MELIKPQHNLFKVTLQHPNFIEEGIVCSEYLVRWKTLAKKLETTPVSWTQFVAARQIVQCLVTYSCEDCWKSMHGQWT